MRLKIRDLEKLTGIPKATLRYYESLGLLSPVRGTNSNYRTYSINDIVRLVQVRQIKALGLQLSELPGEGRDITCTGLYESLREREEALEKEVEQAINQLGRLRLHISSYEQAIEEEHGLKLMRTAGNYRIFPCDENVASHPETAEILRSWMVQTPHVYSVVRVRYGELSSCNEETVPASVGVGLMKYVFDAAGDTFREPMQYSPVSRCVQGVIETPSLERIPRAALTPFLDFLSENTLVPLEDLYGWVIYAPPEGKDEPYRVSMRLSVP